MDTFSTIRTLHDAITAFERAVHELAETFRVLEENWPPPTHVTIDGEEYRIIGFPPPPWVLAPTTVWVRQRDERATVYDSTWRFGDTYQRAVNTRDYTVLYTRLSAS